jgi:hypothetical protein
MDATDFRSRRAWLPVHQPATWALNAASALEPRSRQLLKCQRVWPYIPNDSYRRIWRTRMGALSAEILYYSLTIHARRLADVYYHILGSRFNA